MSSGPLVLVIDESDVEVEGGVLARLDPTARVVGLGVHTTAAAVAHPLMATAGAARARHVSHVVRVDWHVA